MDSLQSQQMLMFVSCTGASEAEAREKLQAFGGDINAAIDSYFSEKESSIAPVHIEEADMSRWMNEDEPQPRHESTPFHRLLSAPTWSSRLPNGRGFRSLRTMASHIPHRGTSPFISQPRDIREIPIDWKDEPRIQSNADLIIEEIPATADTSPPSQLHPHIISDEDVSLPHSNTFKGNKVKPRSHTSSNGLNTRHLNVNNPLIDEVMDVMSINEGDDIEEEVLKAVLEASKKETTVKGFSESSSGTGMHGSRSDPEDDDFVRAISLSLKTAEQEKALREGRGFSWFSEFENIQDDTENDEVLRRRGPPSARDSFTRNLETLKNHLPSDNRILNSSANNVNTVSSDSVEDTDEFEEQPLLGRRSGQVLNPPSVPVKSGTAAEVHQEWGGLSTEEHEEAIMLESAMFGELSDEAARRFHYPTAVMITDGANASFCDSNGYNIERPNQQPPSPSLIAQRLLREQQDDEYLASLVADREKEEKAQREEESRRAKQAEAKAAADTEEKLQREEKLRKHLAEQELKKEKATKRAALPEEPSVDNESALTIMVRLPDGARQSRRFLKSEPLQCLFDFVDVCCGPLPGSYQLVSSYPRRVFSDAERGSSFQELGLNSRYETLFLEVI